MTRLLCGVLQDIAHPDEKVLAHILHEAKHGVVVKPRGAAAVSWCRRAFSVANCRGSSRAQVQM